MPTVSVIIVNWNAGKFLMRCLHDLELQTVKPDRVYVVDNASSDHSADIAESIASTTLLRMRQNLGFAAGNNAAIDQCDTDFVVLLNPDAFPCRDWLQQLLDAAAAYPDVAAFGCRQLADHDHHILDGIGDTYKISGRVWRERHGRVERPQDLQAKEIFSPCAAAALYRRQVLIDIGGFDEDFFCYVEDVDLGFRLRLNGHKAMYVPKAVVLHVGSGTTGGRRSDFSIYYGHRNLVWTFLKNMPGFLFWILLPLHLLLNIGSILWFALQGKGRVVLRAKRDALIGLPAMWRKRQRIQKLRVASVTEIWSCLDKRILSS